MTSVAGRHRMRTDGRVRLPAWAWVLGAYVGVAFLAHATIGERTAGQLCLFRRATGVDCATCGGTRAVSLAAQGRPVEAIAMNPLVALGAPIAVTWAVLSVGWRRPRAAFFTMAGRTNPWWVALVLFMANWVYLIVTGPR